MLLLCSQKERCALLNVVLTILMVCVIIHAVSGEIKAIIERKIEVIYGNKKRI